MGRGRGGVVNNGKEGKEEKREGNEKMNKKLMVVCIGLAMFLLVSSVSVVLAETYEIAVCGAYHVEDDTVAVTPVYATDVIDDTVQGTLRFRVLSHPLEYEQVVAASTNISDIDKPIDLLPIFITLKPDDIVEINYKDCEYSEKVVQKEPLTQNYWIVYTGQANSVTTNGHEIPEFTSVIALATFVLAALIALGMRKKVVKHE